MQQKFLKDPEHFPKKIRNKSLLISDKIYYNVNSKFIHYADSTSAKASAMYKTEHSKVLKNFIRMNKLQIQGNHAIS